MPHWTARRAVLAESRAAEPPALVAYRGPHRWQLVFEPALGDEGASAQRLRKQGVYLITGGLGGIGLALAERLACEWQARLVLVGRSALPARHLWGEVIADPPPPGAARTPAEADAAVAGRGRAAGAAGRRGRCGAHAPRSWARSWRSSVRCTAWSMRPALPGSGGHGAARARGRGGRVRAQGAGHAGPDGGARRPCARLRAAVPRPRPPRWALSAMPTIARPTAAWMPRARLAARVALPVWSLNWDTSARGRRPRTARSSEGVGIPPAMGVLPSSACSPARCCPSSSFRR